MNSEALNDLNKIVDTPELDVVRVVCVDQTGQVLLVQESDDPNWKLPGGKIHANETIMQAIKRESAEELGVTIDAQNILAYAKANIPGSPNYRHVVRADITSQLISKTPEVAQYGYFAIDNLPETKFKQHITTAYEFVK